MDAEHRWLAKTEPGAGGRPASVEKGLGRDHFSFSYSQAIVYVLNFEYQLFAAPKRCAKP